MSFLIRGYSSSSSVTIIQAISQCLRYQNRKGITHITPGVPSIATVLSRAFKNESTSQTRVIPNKVTGISNNNNSTWMIVLGLGTGVVFTLISRKLYNDSKYQQQVKNIADEEIKSLELLKVEFNAEAFLDKCNSNQVDPVDVISYLALNKNVLNKLSTSLHNAGTKFRELFYKSLTKIINSTSRKELLEIIPKELFLDLAFRVRYNSYDPVIIKLGESFAVGFSSEEELKEYAKQHNYPSVAYILSYGSKSLPKFKDNSWQEYFVETFVPFYGKTPTAELNFVTWMLYLGIPFPTLDRQSYYNVKLPSHNEWSMYFAHIDTLSNHNPIACREAFFALTPFMVIENHEKDSALNLNASLNILFDRFQDESPLSELVSRVCDSLKEMDIKNEINARYRTKFIGNEERLIHHQDLGELMSIRIDSSLRDRLANTVIKVCRNEPTVKQTNDLILRFCTFYGFHTEKELGIKKALFLETFLSKLTNEEQQALVEALIDNDFAQRCFVMAEYVGENKQLYESIRAKALQIQQDRLD